VEIVLTGDGAGLLGSLGSASFAIAVLLLAAIAGSIGFVFYRKSVRKH
jgi:hypothetical protein